MAKKFKRPSKAQVEKQIRARRLQTERHLCMSIEDWRLKKRQQWRAVINALDMFTYGSAYTPCGNDLYEMQRAANRIKGAMGDDWVCW